MALASATRWRCPPERLSGYRSAHSDNPTRTSHSRARSLAPFSRNSESDVVDDAHVGEQGTFLKDHTDRPELGWYHHRWIGKYGTVQRNLPGLQGQQPGHQSEQGGLAAARVPNQTGDFTGLTLKRNIV